MLRRFRRLLNQFFSRSGTINNEPLNKVSLIVIILIDIFILVNVFTGLNDISQWYISPSAAYPCYSEWSNYQTKTNKNKDYNIVILAVLYDSNQPTFQQTYREGQAGHLGTVSEVCLDYATYKDKINNAENQQIVRTINQKQTKINTLEQSNRDIRAQYDSTLLEKLAGQPRGQSINAIGAEKAKQTLDQNDRTIATLKQEIAKLESQLVAKPESKNFLAFLKNSQKFEQVENGYQQASFWYPTIQFVFQALFLLPLIFVALFVHSVAQRRGYGLIGLISWHLLVIFLIPLVLKVFEFLQVGVLFQAVFDAISILFGSLLFLVSYLYILLIPLLGFGIIKFFQRIVFNAKAQAASRVQKSRCIRCSKRVRQQDSYCPHCGYYQYAECPNCHDLTYKHLPHCKQCGYAQEPDHS